MKLKYCLAATDSGAWGDDPEDGCGVPVLRSTEIDLDGNLDPKDPANRSLTEREISRTRLARGDLLVVRSSGSDAHLGKTGYVGDGSAGASFSNFLQRIRLAPTHNSRFAWYFMNSTYAKQQIRKLSSTTTGLQNLSAALIGELEIPSPPLEEQRRIADFLDAETATIDSYVNLHERLLSTLREKTSAVIESLLLHGRTQTPDDGQCPDSAPFPSRFPIGRLKNVAARVDVGIAEAATHAYVSDGVPFIRSTNIRPNSLDVGDMLHITPSFAERNRSKYVFAGDILTVRTGNAGVSAVVPQGLDRSQTFTQLITTLRGENSAEYFCQFLNSRVCHQYFDTVSWGSAQKNISVPLLANTPVPIPPVEMQREISASIEHHSQIASSLASKVKRARQLASERRQALITAAVTGQFDVATASGRNVTDGVSA